MKNLIDQSGLVAESDYLSLSDTLAVDKDYLIDRVVGARHKLHRRAIKAVTLLDMHIPLKLWQQYARRQQLTDGELLEILLFLNSIGGLEISRTKRGSINNLITQFQRLVKGLPRVTRARRLPTTIINTNRAVLLAMQPLLIAAFITVGLAFGTKMDVALTIYELCIFLITLWVSTILHEQTHSMVISQKTKNKVILQKGMRLGILHPSLPHKTEFASAFSGPLIGAISSIVFCGLLSILFDDKTLLDAGFLVACFQFVSLLPFYGDGQTIWYKHKRSVHNVT